MYLSLNTKLALANPPHLAGLGDMCLALSGCDKGRLGVE